MQITNEEAVYLAEQAGFTGDALVTIVAIAHAESGLNTEAEGDVDLQTDEWGPSIGLTQIRSLKAEEGQGTQRDRLANYDGLTNFTHAHAISSGGTDFSPWSTYKNGAYKSFLSEVEAAISKSVVTPPIAPVTQAVYHTVVANDTLSEIAAANKLSLDEIEHLNPQIVNPNQIYIGEKVRVK